VLSYLAGEYKSDTGGEEEEEEEEEEEVCVCVCVFVLFVSHIAENITLSLRTFTPSSFYSAELLLFSNCVIQTNKLIILFFFCVALLCVGAGCL